MSSPRSTPTGSRLDALRRTTGDQKIVGGVSGGLAKALNIDPVIIRIAFVVLIFIGFAGPLLYAACWLLVPAEGRDRSPIGSALDLQSDSQVRSVGLVVAAAIALVAVLGDSAWGAGPWIWGPAWVLFWIALLAGGPYWFFVVRPRQRAAAPVHAPPPPYQPKESPMNATVENAAPSTGPSTGEVTVVLDAPTAEGVVPPPVDPVAPVPGPVPPRPPRERWSPALLLVTLSAILAATGVLALWSLVQEPVALAVYPAVALGIVAVGLLVGTKVGHPGALIPVGLLILPVLAVASVIPNLNAGDLDLQPTTAAEIAAPIEQGFGRIRVDLTTIEDPATLGGRTLEIEHGLGATVVVVPDDLDVEVTASLSGGGRIEVFDRVRDGDSPRLHTAPNAPGAYRILIKGTAGEIQVVRS